MSLLHLPGILQQQGAGYNPLTAISWFDAWWAEDPAWTNPGDGNSIPATGLKGNGSDGTDFTITTPTAEITYVDSGNVNSKPAIRFSGATANVANHPSASFGSSLSETWSFVCIAAADVTGVKYLSDGATSDRCIVADNGSGLWRFYTRGNVVSSVAVSTTPRLFVGVSPSTGNNVFEVDGTSANAAVDATTLTGIYVGISRTSTASFDGDIVFQGWYSGNILADGAWGGFESWAGSHYNLTIA